MVKARERNERVEGFGGRRPVRHSSFGMVSCHKYFSSLCNLALLACMELVDRSLLLLLSDLWGETV